MGEEIFIDANIFLEIFLKDNKSEECKSYLKSLQNRSVVAVTTDFVIYSCVLQVQNKLKDTKFMENTIAFFNNLPNFRVLRPSFDDLYNAIEIMENDKLDFDDSLVIACMKNYRLKQLASFDKHFDKIKDIERIKI